MRFFHYARNCRDTFKNGAARTLLGLIMRLACPGDDFLTKISITTDRTGMKADLHWTVPESFLNALFNTQTKITGLDAWFDDMSIAGVPDAVTKGSISSKFYQYPFGFGEGKKYGEGEWKLLGAIWSQYNVYATCTCIAALVSIYVCLYVPTYYLFISNS